MKHSLEEQLTLNKGSIALGDTEKNEVNHSLEKELTLNKDSIALVEHSKQFDEPPHKKVKCQ